MGDDRTPIVKTYLEITDLEQLRPPRRPPRRSFELERIADPELNRWFYEAIGADYAWVDRLGWSDPHWRSWEARVETWMVVVDGERAGYFELEPYPAGRLVQIAYLGLFAAYHGYGIGGHVLTIAIRRGFELGPKVAVSTNTRDAAHALANYEARGMRVVRSERAA